MQKNDKNAGRIVEEAKTRNKLNVRFGVFTAVTIKNAVFWDVMPCGSCKNRRFGVERCS
jgi:hypothetical protein